MIPFDLTLNTPRCTLRIVSEGDVPFVWSSLASPDLPMGWFGIRQSNQQGLIEVNRRNLEAWGEGRAFTFTIVLKATQLPIGRIGIHVEAQEDVWTIRFWIDPEHWGQGLAAEAARQLSSLAFPGLTPKLYGVRMQSGMCKANECSKSSACA